MKDKVKSKIVRHLKDDMKTFEREKNDDKKLIRKLKGKKHESRKKEYKEHKIEKVMHEYKEGKLHSGSKKGPVVRKPKQAIAIALSEAKKRKK